MTIVNPCPPPFPPARSLHSRTIGKLGAVVDRDRLEHGVEMAPEFPLETIEGLYYVLGLAGGDLYRDLLAGRALRELEYPGGSPFLALYGVALPMPRLLPAVNLGLSLLNALARAGSGRPAHFFLFPFLVSLYG